MLKAIAVLGCLGLAGCGTTGGKILENLQGCERHYDGAVSGGILGIGGQFSGTVQVSCPVKAVPATSEAVQADQPELTGLY